MPAISDGPVSPFFSPLPFQGNLPLSSLEQTPASKTLLEARPHAPQGQCAAWGIPFQVETPVVLYDQPVRVEVSPTHARWLVFLHTSDIRPLEFNQDGFIPASSGHGRLGEHAADYVICYADGSEARLPIRRRHQLGAFQRGWGENCFEAVAQHKPHPMRAAHEQLNPGWGFTQTRAATADWSPLMHWLWAWENPHWENAAAEKAIVAIRFEPVCGLLIVSGLAAGNVEALPLRWETRRKACLRLPEGMAFQPDLDKNGLLAQIQLDLGQVISATPRPLYNNEAWESGYNNQMPRQAANEVIIEYTAHPQARFHLWDGRLALTHPTPLPTSHSPLSEELTPIETATQVVKLRVVEKESRKATPVKLHLHGEAGEYLAPVDRHRILNPAWFEDYSVDFAHVDWERPGPMHPCTYINGETVVKLPVGKVYLEVSKGFEIRPVHQVLQITPETQEVVIEIEKRLPWREKGWVTADTHVHFLSPISALLEGAAEGVNVINLLASQWGELMTNVGDFDGRNTWGSRETGGDGEYLVRVGTENRQHVMGHISLLGYRGPIIAPMTRGGPDEAALGDAVDGLLLEWARQCKQQGGLVVLPHFPNPRAEHAAGVVQGEIDAIEMTSWENLYAGIDPYSLSDWYRYLNCGYRLAAVGGTDKMASSTAVGTVRTYARLAHDTPFTYEAWMEAVRRAETFVSYGPLLEFTVEGKTMGSRLELPASGGTLDVHWQVASVTTPVSRVDLIVNGEIRQTAAVSNTAGDHWEAAGHWSVKVDKSSWLALLVRGGYSDRREIIAAHSSPVMALVAGSPLLAAADGVTILEQIEGALVYLDTVGTRAEDRVYKRMRLELEAARRTLHERMHAQGYYHPHP